jgi:hypothetical protein
MKSSPDRIQGSPLGGGEDPFMGQSVPQMLDGLEKTEASYVAFLSLTRATICWRQTVAN